VKTLRLSLTVLSWTLLTALVPCARAWAAAAQDATITVTPVADVSLMFNTSDYAFGPVDVNTSTNSATALTLINNGQVTVAVDKRITVQSAPTGWTAANTAGLDTYVLYTATSTTRPGLAEFGSATKFGAENHDSALTGPSGTAFLMPPAGAGSSVDLWFKLDLPTAV